jgi:hypothetical protein
VFSQALLRQDHTGLPERVGVLDAFVDAIMALGRPVITHHAVKRVLNINNMLQRLGADRISAASPKRARPKPRPIPVRFGFLHQPWQSPCPACRGGLILSARPPSCPCATRWQPVPRPPSTTPAHTVCPSASLRRLRGPFLCFHFFMLLVVGDGDRAPPPFPGLLAAVGSKGSSRASSTTPSLHGSRSNVASSSSPATAQRAKSLPGPRNNSLSRLGRQESAASAKSAGTPPEGRLQRAQASQKSSRRRTDPGLNGQATRADRKALDTGTPDQAAQAAAAV